MFANAVRDEKGPRWAASKQGLASLQMVLLQRGFPVLPLSDHIVNNSAKVMKLLDGD